MNTSSNGNSAPHTTIRLVSDPTIFAREAIAVMPLATEIERSLSKTMHKRYPDAEYSDLALTGFEPSLDRTGFIAVGIHRGIRTKISYSTLKLDSSVCGLSYQDAGAEVILAIVMILEHRCPSIRFDVSSSAKRSVLERALEIAQLQCPDLRVPNWVPNFDEVVRRPEHLDFKA